MTPRPRTATRPTLRRATRTGSALLLPMLLLMPMASALAGDDDDDAPEPVALDAPLALATDTSQIELRVPAVVPPGFPVPITLVNHTAEEVSVYARCADDAVQDEDGAFFDIDDSHRKKKMAMPTDELAPGSAKELCVWDGQVEVDNSSGLDRVPLPPGRYRYVLTVEPRADKAALDLGGFPSAPIELTHGTPLVLDEDHTVAMGTIVHVPDRAMYLRLDDAMSATMTGGEHFFGADLTVFADGKTQRVGLSLGNDDPSAARAVVGDYELALRWVDAWQHPASVSLTVSRHAPAKTQQTP